MKVQDLNEHKKAFYIGSILPDLKPSFLTKRHNIDETFDILIEEIRKITVEYDANKGINGYYARHLGVITHYLADYCTFPHNTDFTGTFSEHVYYEKELKKLLKKYVKQDVAKKNREAHGTSRTLEEIEQFIRNTHAEYLKAWKAVKVDIKYIVYLCHKVVDAILSIFELALRTSANEFGQKPQMEYIPS
jgi:hypothetical protein